jgi:hypothetical protein
MELWALAYRLLKIFFIDGSKQILIESLSFLFVWAKMVESLKSEGLQSYKITILDYNLSVGILSV